MLNVIKSASIIIRKSTGEVYLGLRSKKLRTFPNFWVFPGGKIDEELDDNWKGTEKEVIDTILRELYEEIGLVIGNNNIFEANDREREINKISYNSEFRNNFIQKIEYVGKKDTPPFTNKIYSAAYYYIKSEMFDNLMPKVDGQELVQGMWIHPELAIQNWIDGKILLPPPILHLLRKIDTENFIKESLEETFLPTGFQSKIEIYPNIEFIPINSSTIKPFFNTNLIIIEGYENYILVDPGANKNGEEHLELILEKLTKPPIIFLTHHHLDHWEGLKLIEKIFPDAIVYAHKNTNSRIDTKLNKINVNEGYILNPGGKLYQVIDLFGHTDGHIGLLNEKKDVLISGDHIVGVGSTVLDYDNGSMIEYMKTCSKIRKLSIDLILPAHGPPIFDPKNLIVKYIEHRINRENNILKIVKKGIYSINEILKLCYADTPLEMHVFAKRNLLLHINKLIAEQKIDQNKLIYD